MKYLIERYQGKILSCLLGEDGRAVEFHADLPQEALKVGDIVVGRVDRVCQNQEAAFVCLAGGVKGYLPLEDLKNPVYTRKGPCPRLQPGDELVVQISREAFGTKDRVLTSRLELAGQNLVLKKDGCGLGISRKIGEETRKKLKESLFSEETLAHLTQDIGPCGVTVRTNAAGADPSQVRKELRRLAEALRQILLTAPYRPAYTVLLSQTDRWLKRTDSLHQESTEAILTDDKDLYDRLKGYLPPILQDRLRLYQDEMISMHNVFSLTRELGQALARKVSMKSGANLVIDQTEALVAIDVNLAHFLGGKHEEKERAVLRVNLEAARECARQIRLRNLSGMVLIDFINMEEETSYETLLQELRGQVSRDPLQVKLVDRTGLGLVELTRKKVEVPLKDQLAQPHSH